MVRDATINSCSARRAAKHTFNGIGIVTSAAGAIAAACAIASARGPGDPLGACCLGDEQCQKLTESDCLSAHGVWQGEGVDCADAACDPLGACCIPFDTCVTTTIIECFGPLGGVVWAPSQSCATYSCPPLGACCFPDDSCQITLESTCRIALDGEFQGAGVACDDASCRATNPADLDGDGIVGPADLAQLLASWGPCLNCPSIECPADIAGDDCLVGPGDLAQLLANWG